MNSPSKQPAAADSRSTASRSTTSPAPAPLQLSRRKKQIFSVLIALHLLAIIAAPLATPPTSGAFGSLLGGLQWYIEPMFMNHGYRFFGPDPGPSHLVEYQVELPDGQRIEGVFPNLDANWPRLLYHRHFMLTERLQAFPEVRRPPAVMLAAGAIAGLASEQVLIDLPGNLVLDETAKSYAQHLYHKHGAKRVRLTLVRHRIPEPQWVENGMTLRDPRLYFRWPLIEYAGEAEGEENARPSGPQPERPQEKVGWL